MKYESEGTLKGVKMEVEKTEAEYSTASRPSETEHPTLSHHSTGLRAALNSARSQPAQIHPQPHPRRSISVDLSQKQRHYEHEYEKLRILARKEAKNPLKLYKEAQKRGLKVVRRQK